MATNNFNTTPRNTNTLQSNKFNFILPDFPHIVYFAQTVTVPSISTSPVIVPTPFSDTYRHGDKMVYDPLNITFLLDEDLKNWEESYNWLKGITYPHERAEYSKQKDKFLYRDATLTLLTNSNVPNIRIKFIRCHPTSLGPITMASTDDANVTPVCDLTLQFDTFEIERINR